MTMINTLLDEMVGWLVGVSPEVILSPGLQAALLTEQAPRPTAPRNIILATERKHFIYPYFILLVFTITSY